MMKVSTAFFGIHAIPPTRRRESPPRFVYLCEDNRRQPPVQERLDKWTKIRLRSEDARNDCETILVLSQKRIVMLVEIYGRKRTLFPYCVNQL